MTLHIKTVSVVSQIITDGFRLNNEESIDDDEERIDDDDAENENDDNEDLSFTHETILKYPEFFDDGGKASNAG